MDTETLSAEIVLFDGVDELDAIGPFEVLQNGARAGGELETRLVTVDPADRITASHGLRIEPDGTLAGDGRPDFVLVPGGGWTTGGDGVRAVVEDGRLPERVARLHEDGTTVASVCTGAMVLAEAGVLEGRPATTHHDAVGDLERYATVTDARVVDDGDVLTAGGVTAGIDLALWLLEREFGADVAARVAREMEHERRGDVVR